MRRFYFFQIFDMIFDVCICTCFIAASPAIQMVSYINGLSKFKQSIFIAQQMLIR